MARNKPYTHEEFLEKLWENNEHYRNGEFEVVNKYKNYYAKIQVKNKYGICTLTSALLIGGSNASIVTAKNKTEYFKEEVKESNEKYRNGEFLITGYYKGRLEKILVEDKYGECEMYPGSLIKGSYPGIVTAINKESYFIKKLNIIKPNLNIKIIGELQMNGKHTYFKTEFGIVRIRYTELFRKNYNNISIKSAVNLSDYWVRRSKTVRSDHKKIDYSRVEYLNNKNKVKLRCKEHDYTYLQRPSHHVAGVQGCVYCMKQTIMYTKENFKNHKEFFKNFEGYLYILNLKNEGENFYKVGVVGKDRLEYRMNHIKKYYSIEQTYLEEGFIEDKYNIEQQFLKEFEKYKYTPKKKFGGYTECLTINPIDAYYDWYNN